MLSQVPDAWFRTKSGIPRWLAIIMPTASSAVDVSWTPAALAKTQPSGRTAATPSYPIDWLCTSPTSTPSSAASAAGLPM
ncbi:hypothetical protein D9M72_496410 [compost metagenome]